MSLWKKYIGAALLSLMFMAGTAMADRVLLLSDGQSVILRDDGTWSYIDDKVTGVLTLKFGKTLDQQGRCYAWPSLTNDTDRYIDGISKCKIDGIQKNPRICYELLEVSAEDMQAIK